MHAGCLEKMGTMRLGLLVMVVVLMMSSCAAEGRIVAVAEAGQQKLVAVEDVGVDSRLDDNHHTYSIPDFNRAGGRAPAARN